MPTAFTLAALLLASVLPVALAQNPAEPEAKAKVEVQLSSDLKGNVSAVVDSTRHNSQDAIRILSDLQVSAGDEVNDAVVAFARGTVDGLVRRQLTSVASDLTLNGKVNRDLVVVFGKVKLGPDAEVRGDTILVGCQIERAPGAKLARRPVEIGTTDWFPKLRWATDYLSQGVLLLRPLPPGVEWAWVAVAMFGLVYLLMQVLFPAPVQASVSALQERPVTSLFSGLLASILFAPVCVLLAATGIGLLLLPLVLLAFISAVLMGKAAVLRYIGHQLGRQVKSGALENGLLALAVGGGIVCLLYMVPVLGVFAWATATLLGLGATVVATVQHLSKENEKPASEIPPVPTDALAAMGEAALPRVGFWKRLFATLLDFVLIGVVFGIVSKGWLVPPAWFLYHVIMWWWKGTTIGGIVFGLKIVREDGRPVTFGVAFVRSLASLFSLIALGLGFFWAGWSRAKRAWHDRIAGTLVVQMPRDVAAVNEGYGARGLLPRFEDELVSPCHQFRRAQDAQVLAFEAGEFLTHRARAALAFRCRVELAGAVIQIDVGRRLEADGTFDAAGAVAEHVEAVVDLRDDAVVS